MPSKFLIFSDYYGTCTTSCAACFFFKIFKDPLVHNWQERSCFKFEGFGHRDPLGAPAHIVGAKELVARGCFLHTGSRKSRLSSSSDLDEVFGGNSWLWVVFKSFLSKFLQNSEGLFVRTLDTKADLERGVPWMLSSKDISIKEAKNTCVLCPAMYDTKVLLHLTFLPLRISISKLWRCGEVKGEVFNVIDVASNDAWDLCSLNPSSWLKPPKGMTRWHSLSPKVLAYYSTFPALLETLFATLDLDRNGRIDLEETFWGVERPQMCWGPDLCTFWEGLPL